MSQYHNSNLLYRPSISIWTARIKDKSESVKVNENAGAVAGAANVYKQLLPESAELKAVQQQAATFRTWVYDSTLPWDDSGWRIGRVVRHMDFMTEAADYMTEFNTRVEAFLAVYVSTREEARFKLNNMFNDMDYPGVDEVRRKFAITMDCTSLPNTEDFRVVDGIPQEEVDRLVGVATNSVETRVKAAQQEAYDRLYAVVNKMADTLEGYSTKAVKKFNDTLVTNIADLVSVMPALNILGDPALDALAEDAKKLTDFTPEDLRKDDKTRKAAIDEARALANKFKLATTVNPGRKVPPAAAPAAPTLDDAPAAPPLPKATSMAAALRDMITEE
jgi:hypothetical protein